MFCFQDAHNAILKYDTDSSLFAVYDGHGGHEVAKYCAQRLPNFIKNNEDYQKGDIDKVILFIFAYVEKLLFFSRHYRLPA
jgi:protein phosphatase 1G